MLIDTSDSISEMQTLELEKIKRVKFEGFDGERIVSLLKDNRDLWSGVLFSDLKLQRICDLENNKWNSYTLYILSADGQYDGVQTLSIKLGAENIHGLQPLMTAGLLWLPETNKKSLFTLTWWE